MRIAANPALITLRSPKRKPPTASVIERIRSIPEMSQASGLVCRCLHQKRSAISTIVEKTERVMSNSIRAPTSAMKAGVPVRPTSTLSRPSCSPSHSAFHVATTSFTFSSHFAASR